MRYVYAVYRRLPGGIERELFAIYTNTQLAYNVLAEQALQHGNALNNTKGPTAGSGDVLYRTISNGVVWFVRKHELIGGGK